MLYVNDSRRGHIRAFDMLPNGMLGEADATGCSPTCAAAEPGVPDGMKVDVAGNVYCGGAGGLWILDPKGKKLGRIVHGQPATTNIAFGGDDWKTLYFTTRDASRFGEREDPRHSGAGAEEEIAACAIPSPHRGDERIRFVTEETQTGGLFEC